MNTWYNDTMANHPQQTGLLPADLAQLQAYELDRDVVFTPACVEMCLGIGPGAPMRQQLLFRLVDQVLTQASRAAAAGQLCCYLDVPACNSTRLWLTLQVLPVDGSCWDCVLVRTVLEQTANSKIVSPQGD